MRIVLICEATFPESKGGLERWMVWLAKSLFDYGHEVIYLNAQCINTVRDGVQYISVREKPWSYSSSGRRSVIQTLLFGIKTYAKLGKIECDVIYATQAPILSLFFIYAAKLRKRNDSVMIVEWLEIWPINYWQDYLGKLMGFIGFLIQNRALRIGEKKVCFTEHISKKLTKSNPNEQVLKLPGIAMQNQVIILPPFSSKQNIIFLSRLVPEKQPLLAIDSVVKFKETGWSGIFYMVGTGPLLKQLSEYIDAMEAESYIKLLINIPDEKVEEIFKSSFVLLHTSKREGFGLALIEAAAYGVPPILLNYPENLSTGLGILPELVCDFFSPDEISNKLQKAHQNQEYHYQRTEDWLKTKYPLILATKSLSLLDKEFKSFFS
jgi:glycosyltransferase involved in cell wall biosynthesis